MKIAILGAGKMGAWLASHLSAENEVAIFDRDASKAGQIKGVMRLEAISGMKGFSPDLFINAVSLQNTQGAFAEALPSLPKSCVISDVASVKGDLGKFYAKSGFAFASVHPMFGPTFANMESLREENAIVISESDRKTADFFTHFFARLGVKVHEMSFEEHDKMMAYSLTTPFVSSLVFASCVDNTAVPGATFARHMKIAKGVLSEDDHLLCEILFNPKSVQQIDQINSRLELLKHIIKGRDYEEAQDFLGKLRKKIE
ncbi:MAG TPA: prephenate dehydrogenase/arogenate dehydrogenase family protein [Candidatus Micrarchaeota archaeon]|nr:prephenate dehydrogenase/arogenate dehydrogenase family protein [Candidatus Micrarchaeota archaeon]